VAKDSISWRKKKAYRAIFISIFITAVIVLLKLEMTRIGVKITLLALTLSPYGFLTLIACCTSKKRALQNIWVLSCANCIIGSIAYIILYPSSPWASQTHTGVAGGGASMAGLIFFFVPFVQFLLAAVFSIFFAISKSAKSN